VMAIIKTMVGRRIIDGFRGVIDFYVYMGVPCARKWPRSQGKSQTPASIAQWPVWRNANELWRQLSPEVIRAYQDMTAGTNLTARDMFFRGYVSGTLRYFIPVDELEES
ncbi:unnamed protein product, partial [marine sediment metagenome]